MHSSTHVTLKVFSLHTHSNTHNFITHPVTNIQSTSIQAYAHSPPTTRIIRMNSCVQIPHTCTTHTFFIFFHPPAPYTPTQTHGTGPGISFRAKESTLVREHFKSWYRGQRWLDDLRQIHQERARQQLGQRAIAS